MKHTENIFLYYSAGLLASALLSCFIYCFIHSAEELIRTNQQEVSEQLNIAQFAAESLVYDEKAKADAVVSLVNRASEYLKKNHLVTACHAFSHTKDFIDGEVYVFVMDTRGVFLAHGNQQELIWQNYYNYKDSLGAPVSQYIIQKAKEGGGWVTYEWRGASKVTYVQMVEKEGKEFIVAAGYYPHSKQDMVVNLVKGAVEVVKKDIIDGRPIEQAFSTIEYRKGRFVIGDLYLYAMRFDGEIFAHGLNPKLVGTNSLEYKDNRGVFINKEIIQKLKEKSLGQGLWIEYISHNALKKAYTEKITDSQGVEYFIGCGYYPDSNKDRVTDLVRKGYQFMKGHGLSRAVKEFSRARKNEYNYGDLFIFPYDLQGNLIADQNKDAIGQNHFNLVDEDGRLWVQELIKKAQDGGGWIDLKLNKLFKSIYVELIDLGTDTYVIGSGFYPSSKQEMIKLLAKSAISYLHANTLEVAFAQFIDAKGKFVRGDLFVSVFDLNGNCYAHGTEVSKIWDNIINIRDDENKQYIKFLIKATEQGPALITYTINKRPVIAHAERIDKDGTTFIVSSYMQL